MTGLMQRVFPESVIISCAVHEALPGIDYIIAYLHIQTHFALLEDYETSEEWVVGRVQGSISEIKSGIRKEVWDALLRENVIHLDGDTVILPLLIRKEDLLDEARVLLKRIEKRYLADSGKLEVEEGDV
jgi:hypothetical protein